MGPVGVGAIEEEPTVAVEELDVMLEVFCNAELVTVGTAEDAEAREELY